MLQTHISKKQQEIIRLLYRFRFLNRYHIQTLLHHKTPITINNWLKDLTEKQYIGRIFKRSWTENTIPARYYLSKQGIKYLRTLPEIHKPDIRRLYKDRTRSLAFIEYCLFIADRYIQFLLKTSNTASEYQFYTQSDFSPNSLMRDLKPDYVIVDLKQNSYTLHELIDESTPRYAIRKRISAYLEFFDDEGSNLNAGVVIICLEKPFDYVSRYIKKLKETDESLPELLVKLVEEMKQNEIVIS